MTNTEDRNRRLEDQHPAEPLQWDTKQPLVDAALAHLAQEHSAAGVIPVPHTNPQQFIAIGTAIEIGGLLPEGFGTSATGQAAAAVRALLLELTTFDGKMVSGNYLEQRAAGILALQVAPERPSAPAEMSAEMMRAVQLHSELGAHVASTMSGAYDLFREFWRVAMAAAPQTGAQEGGSP